MRRLVSLMSLMLVLLLFAACSSPELDRVADDSALQPLAAGGAQWRVFGQNIHNTRHAKTESKIGPDNVADLEVRWIFETGGDVSATPAVDGEHLYVPDWAGNLFKLDRRTGELLWVNEFEPQGNFARATPALYEGVLIVGDQGGRVGQGATLTAFDQETGSVVWSTLVEAHPAAIVTQSAAVFDDRVYVGVASLEELLATDPNYPCCTFRGSVVALDARTGAILWKTYTAPAGYSGNAVWGGMPVVDVERKQLYVATGNNYEVPQDVLACVEANQSDPAAVEACIAPDDHFGAILALDLDTGEILWDVRALAFDSWTVACLFPDEAPESENCTSPAVPARDFGEGPSLFTVRDNGGKPREVVGAGQKSGQYWVVDPDSGAVVWVTKVGPGGVLGGMIWGSAVDGERVYVANANSSRELTTLLGGAGVEWGFWSALDAATGEILWQTADPLEATNQGPVTVANGVVYACSLDDAGHMHAMSAATGEILWSFASGGSCNAGAAVVNGSVYWGSGYGALATGNTQLYAFDLGE